MAKLTRRGLIKQASISAGAAGALAAVVAAGVHIADTQPVAATVNVTGDPLTVFVTDASTLVIMRGESSITVKNVDLAQRLLTLK